MECGENMKREINGELLNVPEHVAVIMDGNGRWAKKRFLPRNYGHAEGAKALEAICENCDKLGIKYLTVYAFSTENWKRSVEEVTGIMNLFRKYLVDSIERSNNSNMKVNLIGKREGLPEDIVQKMDDLERETAGNTGLQFHIAINYGGRDEIVRAVKKIMKDADAGKISADDIDESLFAEYLDTKGVPDPDLLIRTSGEERTSNFLPWQLAYSEFYFTDTLWPDLDMDSLIEAVRYYNKREKIRRCKIVIRRILVNETESDKWCGSGSDTGHHIIFWRDSNMRPYGSGIPCGQYGAAQSIRSEQEDSGNRVLPGDSSVLYSHIPGSYGHYCSYDGRIFIGYACCVCADIPNIQR